jgi:hypothetical protein
MTRDGSQRYKKKKIFGMEQWFFRPEVGVKVLPLD